MFLLTLLGLLFIIFWIRALKLDEQLYDFYLKKVGKIPVTLQGKTVVITGASSGIGEEFALECAKRNVQLLILGARRVEKLEEVKKKCQQIGAQKVLCIRLDVAELSSCKAFFEEAKQNGMKQIDYLLLNAGIGAKQSFLNTTEQDLERIHRQLMNINYFGCVNCTHLALPLMKHSSSSMKHISVVTSLSGKFASPERTAYCASKHALHGFFNALRTDLKLDPLYSQVRVNVLALGHVWTDFQASSLGAEEGVIRDKKKYISPAKAVQQMFSVMDRSLGGEYILPLSGRLANSLFPVLPISIVDSIATKTVQQASRVVKSNKE